uniref:Ion_trans domain-containing protein n=2 Tax=Macrostomum lignano TaxID=282301 RepID=A0A1I8HKA1_9PLAT
RCLRFMNESDVDFSRISDNGFTAYHVLMSAIRFMTDESADSASGSGITEECKSLLALFHKTLFTAEQQRRMLNVTCKLGMAPLSWGVFLGLANYVEYIMTFCVPAPVVNSDAAGLNERVSIDVSEMTGDDSSFFTSPICVLVDMYGQSTLAEIKALGIFRTGFIWKQWAEVLYMRNRFFTALLLSNVIFLTAATVSVVGGGVNDFLKARCSGRDFPFPIGVFIILVYWFFYATFGTAASGYSLWRKEQYRRKVGYPIAPRHAHVDMLFWFLPWMLSIPISTFLLWLYSDTGNSCRLLGDHICSVSGCCILLLLLTSVSLIVAYLRLVPSLTTLMTSMYKSIGTFTVFIMLYLVLTGVFTRVFQVRLFSASSDYVVRNSTSISEENSGPKSVNFFTAFYRTFLVSLNIIDSSMLSPTDDRIDMSITHMIYILFVPVLFLNFAIGILTSVVTHVHEHSPENRYLLILSVAEFSEMILSPTRSAIRKLVGSSGEQLVLRCCRPVSRHSRLLAANNERLSAVLEAKNCQQN